MMELTFSLIIAKWIEKSLKYCECVEKCLHIFRVWVVCSYIYACKFVLKLLNQNRLRVINKSQNKIDAMRKSWQT